MKKTMITMLLLALTMGVAAQSADSTSEKNDTAKSEPFVCQLVEQQPSFPGGDEALKKFFKKNLRYPRLAEDYDVEGTVIMTFFVEKDGTLTNISAHDCKIDRFNTTKFSQETEAKQKQLKEQFALLFAKEGARVIRKMPKWIPGRYNDDIVRIKFNLPIRFRDPSK